MILIKNANLISMEEINYEICDILIEGKIISKIGKLDEKDYPNAKVIDADKIAKELSKICSKAYIVTLDNSRSLNALEYAKILKDLNVEANPYESVNDALNSALNEAKNDDAVLICVGSLYLYKEVSKCYDKKVK